MNIRTHLLCFRLRYWSRQTNRYWFSASIHRQLKPTSVQWPLPSSASFSPPLIVIMLATASMLVPSLHLPLTNYSSSMARALRPLSLQKFNTPVHNPLSLYFFYHFSFLRIFLSRWSSPRNLKLKTIPLPLSNALCSMLTVRNLYIFRQLFYPFISEGCPWHSILRLGSAPVRSQDCRWQPERNTNYRVQWKRHRHHHG